LRINRARAWLLSLFTLYESMFQGAGLNILDLPLTAILMDEFQYFQDDVICQSSHADTDTIPSLDSSRSVPAVIHD
jgi:hypothetical protein